MEIRDYPEASEYPAPATHFHRNGFAKKILSSLPEHEHTEFMLELTAPLILSLSLSAEVATTFKLKVETRGQEQVIEYVIPSAPTRPKASTGVAHVQWLKDFHSPQDVYKDAFPKDSQMSRSGAPGTKEIHVLAGTVITIDPPPGGSQAWVYILSKKQGALKIGPLPTTDFEWSLSKVDWDQERRWFKDKNCTSLEIRQHKSAANHAVVHSATVTDPGVLKNLIARIAALPENGEMMIDMGPGASYVEVNFHCPSGVRQLEIYDGRLKTPSTGFNTEAGDAEKKIVADIMTYLSQRK